MHFEASFLYCVVILNRRGMIDVVVLNMEYMYQVHLDVHTRLVTNATQCLEAAAELQRNSCLETQ